MQKRINYRIFNMHEKIRATTENLRRLPKAICLAQEMGKGMERSAVL